MTALPKMVTRTSSKLFVDPIGLKKAAFHSPLKYTNFHQNFYFKSLKVKEEMSHYCGRPSDKRSSSLHLKFT